MGDVITQLLEDVVTKTYGFSTWEQVTFHVRYDVIVNVHESFQVLLLRAAAKVLHMDSASLLFLMGEHFGELVYKDGLSVLVDIEIEPRRQFLRLVTLLRSKIVYILKDALAPEFAFSHEGEYGLILHVQMRREEMSPLFRGAIVAIARLCGHAVEVKNSSTDVSTEVFNVSWGNRLRRSFAQGRNAYAS